MSKKNNPQPIALPPTTSTTSTGPAVATTVTYGVPRLFPVTPAEARDLADRAHDELPQLLETAAAAIRTAAAKGAYSTTISGKSPLIETLADRLARAGYTTRALPGGMLVQWS